ncbi:hypothetical protein [Sinorhizobium sp. BG8]|uniref:hypothetical protein n=1 Tax=Sinorhizobium sp. BG8 TaxID=2613773 RepID=UPI00193E440E|nr:hypothetical protein [Sinorhizobium sp. BG8]QRM54893.1 hypothetical protein F3Y30_10310 [Sinorhizobium sp. BG8]
MNRTVIAANFALFLSLVVAAQAWPAGDFVLVVAAPGSNPATVHSLIARSGGSYVGPSRFGWMAVAYSQSSDFAQRLLGEGAFLVLNHAFATGCLQKDRS